MRTALYDAVCTNLITKELFYHEHLEDKKGTLFCREHQKLTKTKRPGPKIHLSRYKPQKTSKTGRETCGWLAFSGHRLPTVSRQLRFARYPESLQMLLNLKVVHFIASSWRRCSRKAGRDGTLRERALKIHHDFSTTIGTLDPPHWASKRRQEDHKLAQTCSSFISSDIELS